MVIADLVDQGYRLQVLDQTAASVEYFGRTYKVLVHADDADVVREALVESGLL